MQNPLPFAASRTPSPYFTPELYDGLTLWWHIKWKIIFPLWCAARIIKFCLPYRTPSTGQSNWKMMHALGLKRKVSKRANPHLLHACLWIMSMSSFIIIPLKFRAYTSTALCIAHGIWINGAWHCSTVQPPNEP